jgi:hypothetical protein
MAKSPAPAPQQGSTPPASQQQGQTGQTTPQQGTPVIRDWASI